MSLSDLTNILGASPVPASPVPAFRWTRPDGLTVELTEGPVPTLNVIGKSFRESVIMDPADESTPYLLRVGTLRDFTGGRIYDPGTDGLQVYWTRTDGLTVAVGLDRVSLYKSPDALASGADPVATTHSTIFMI